MRENASSPPFLKTLRRRSEFWLTAVILVVGTVFALTARDFLSLANVIDLLETYSVQSIMAMGLFVVLVSGGIDISFAATASVAQYCAALLAAQMGLPPPLVILAGLAIGILLGCINAALVHYFRITSIWLASMTSETSCIPSALHASRNSFSPSSPMPWKL